MVTPTSEPGLFAQRPPERTPFPWLPVVLAGVVLLVLAGALLLHGRQGAAPATGNTLQPLAPEAQTLPISGIEMSESTSLSGGKSTFIDGHLHNGTSRTITGATVQVLFANDAGEPPAISTLPLTLIRTQQPYIDTEPVSAEPIHPGQDREFRLIFEAVDPNWNQSVPEIHIVHVTFQ